jgi:hypothetical protein
MLVGFYLVLLMESMVSAVVVMQSLKWNKRQKRETLDDIYKSILNKREQKPLFSLPSWNFIRNRQREDTPHIGFKHFFVCLFIET